MVTVDGDVRDTAADVAVTDRGGRYESVDRTCCSSHCGSPCEWKFKGLRGRLFQLVECAGDEELHELLVVGERVALVVELELRGVDFFGQGLREGHRRHHVGEQFALDGLFGGRDLGVFGLGRVVDFAAYGVLARLADGREHVFDDPLLELTGVGHAACHNEAVEVGLVDCDHRLLAALGVHRNLLAEFGFAFHKVLRVGNLAAVDADDLCRALGVAQNLAHVVGDEPHFLVLVLHHSDIGTVENTVAQLERGRGGRVELFCLGRFFLDGGQGLATDFTVEVGITFTLDFGFFFVQRVYRFGIPFGGGFGFFVENFLDHYATPLLVSPKSLRMGVSCLLVR